MKNNKSGYSVILSILMVGFMLVLTSGVFMLVLSENKDTKAMEYYLKAFAGAEGSIEIALLKAKKYNYSYSETLTTSQPLSKALFRDNELYNFTKDVFISFDLDATGGEIMDKELESGKFEIIPLFYYDQAGNLKKVTQIQLSGVNEIVWNIIGETSGISGVGNFTNTTQGNYKTLGAQGVSYTQKKIGDFLEVSSNQHNYLILHNTSNDTVKYNLKSLKSGEYLTKETSEIIGTGEVGGYKQNLKVSVNSSEYLNLLKYSIFSN
ncbi:MAG: hypothetical protein AB7E37_04170 [Candidatus Altimarinota bacterium]